MAPRLKVLLPFAVAVLSAPLVHAQTFTFSSSLTGSTTCPPTGSAATGTGTWCYDSTTMMMEYTVTVSGMSGTAAHIHSSPVGFCGGIEFPLAGGPTVWTGVAGPFSPAQEALLFAGDLYVNVHSTAFPSGEIRDQLNPAPTPSSQTVRTSALPPFNPTVWLPGPPPGPVAGGVWTPTLDASLYGPTPVSLAAQHFVAVTLLPASPEIPLGVEGPWILCDPVTLLFTLDVGPTVPGPIPVSIPIPSACSLIGVGVCTQAATIDLQPPPPLGPLPVVRFGNALDVVIGSL